ncbi:MAG: SHOCT domain-containing protein [Cyanobacteria bacterium P01_A01_bin.83]
MAINYFIAKEDSLDSLYKKLILWFKERQYVVDAVENSDEYLIQARKTGTFRTLTGTNQAFKIKITWSHNSDNENEFIFETSTGKWVSNLAGAGVTAMFTGGFTVLTGLAGAGWALVVETNIIDYVENQLNYKKIKNEVKSLTTDNKINHNTSQVEKSEVNKNTISSNVSPQVKAEEKLKQEIDILAKAYQDGILEKQEYEAKTDSLKAKIFQYEIDFTVEEKMQKLEQAFVQGVINESEYESKVTKIRETVEKDINQRKVQEENLALMIKFKQALDSGILTKEEYEAKTAKLKTINA